MPGIGFLTFLVHKARPLALALSVLVGLSSLPRPHALGAAGPSFGIAPPDDTQAILLVRWKPDARLEQKQALAKPVVAPTSGNDGFIRASPAPLAFSYGLRPRTDRPASLNPRGRWQLPQTTGPPSP